MAAGNGGEVTAVLDIEVYTSMVLDGFEVGGGGGLFVPF